MFRDLLASSIISGKSMPFLILMLAFNVCLCSPPADFGSFLDFLFIFIELVFHDDMPLHESFNSNYRGQANSSFQSENLCSSSLGNFLEFLLCKSFLFLCSIYLYS